MSSVIQTTACPNCQSPLVVLGIGENEPIRCGKCRSHFARGQVINSSRLSWVALSSFVLAMCSLLLGFVTGIPAILLGALALVQLKRRPRSLHGHVFAIVGMLIGSVLTISCGSVVGFAVWTAQSMRRTTDPAEIKSITDEFGTFEFPPQVELRRASIEPMGMKTVSAHDRPNRNKSTIVIGLNYLPRFIAPNSQQARTLAKNQRHLLRGDTSESTHVHRVEVSGEDVEITEEIRTTPDGERFRSFLGALPAPDGFVGTIVSLKQLSEPASDEDPFPLTLEQVLDFFASYRPPSRE